MHVPPLCKQAAAGHPGDMYRSGDDVSLCRLWTLAGGCSPVCSALACSRQVSQCWSAESSGQPTAEQSDAQPHMCHEQSRGFQKVVSPTFISLFAQKLQRLKMLVGRLSSYSTVICSPEMVGESACLPAVPGSATGCCLLRTSSCMGDRYRCKLPTSHGVVLYTAP